MKGLNETFNYNTWSAQMPPPPCMQKPNATIISKNVAYKKKLFQNLKKAIH